MILTTVPNPRVSPIFTITAIISIYYIGKLIYKIFTSQIDDPRTNPTIPQQKWKIPTSQTRVDPTFGYSYMKVPLLTRRELRNYHFLKEIADERNLLVCPKVRLLDLVIPKPGLRNQRGLKARVMSKHVDFVICQQDMEVVCIIELDDTTHLRPDRIQRDQFVDSVLTGAGYKIIHTWEITSDILDFYGTPRRKEPEYKTYVNRTEPTYEEWKAAKLAAERQKNEDQSAPAPGQNEPENCTE